DHRTARVHDRQTVRNVGVSPGGDDQVIGAAGPGIHGERDAVDAVDSRGAVRPGAEHRDLVGAVEDQDAAGERAARGGVDDRHVVHGARVPGQDHGTGDRAGLERNPVGAGAAVNQQRPGDRPVGGPEEVVTALRVDPRVAAALGTVHVHEVLARAGGQQQAAAERAVVDDAKRVDIDVRHLEFVGIDAHRVGAADAGAIEHRQQVGPGAAVDGERPAQGRVPAVAGADVEAV